jgi:hypothetical protein
MKIKIECYTSKNWSIDEVEEVEEVEEVDEVELKHRVDGTELKHIGKIVQSGKSAVVRYKFDSGQYCEEAVGENNVSCIKFTYDKYRHLCYADITYRTQAGKHIGTKRVFDVIEIRNFTIDDFRDIVKNG